MGDASVRTRDSRDTAPPPRVTSRRRKLAWFVVVLFVMLAVCFVAVLLVSRSSIPQRLVESQLEQRTGLRFEIAQLEVGWFGTTTARDITITLPLDDATLAHVPLAEVSHSNLLNLLPFLSFHVERIDLRRPILHARRNEAGAWNLEHAFARLAAQLDDGGEASNDIPQLPDLRVDDANLEISHGGEVVETLALSFAGQAPRALEYQANLSVEGVGEASASLAIGATWRHDLAVKLDSAQPLIRALALDGIDALTSTGRWQGELTPDGTLRGRLSLEALTTDRVEMHGAALLTASDAGVTLEPDDLWIDPAGDDPLAPLRLHRGAVSIAGEHIRLNNLALSVQAVDAEASGDWNLRHQRGEVEAIWNIPAGAYGQLRHHGSATLVAALRQAGRIQIQGEVDAFGRGGGQAYESNLSLAVRGPSLDELHLRLSFPTLLYRDGQGEVELSGLRLEGDYQDDAIRLASLSVPQAQSTFAEGSYHLQTRQWSLLLEADQLTLPRVDLPPFDLALESSGTGGESAQWQAAAIGTGFQARSQGRYDALASKPLEASAAVDVALDEGEAGLAKWAGGSTLQVDVAGGLEPLDLAGRARITGRRLAYGDANLGDLGFEGDVNLRGGAFALESDEFQLLEGTCVVSVEQALEGEGLRVSLQCRQAQLARVSDLLHLEPALAGVFDASLRARLHGADLARAEVEGEWQVSALQAGKFEADTAAGRITAENGAASLTDLDVRRNGGNITGRARFDLISRRDLAADVAVSDWPVSIGQLDLGVGGWARGTLDVVELTARGDVQAASEMIFRGRDLGRIELAGSITERTLDVDEISLEAAGGTVAGTLNVPLDRWTATTADLQADSIDLTAFAAALGLAEGVAGTGSGSITAGPADDPRAFGPLKLRADLVFDSADYRGIDVGSAEFVAYLGAQRSVLDVGVVHAAGGQIDLWASTNMHADERYVQAHARCQGLDLNELVSAVRQLDDPVPGQVDGHLSAAGYLDGKPRLFGEGRLQLTQSDLVHLPVVDVLYGALNLVSARDIGGFGDARFTLNDRTLQLTNLRYYNRGAEILLRGEVVDIFEGAQSPVTGVGVGFVRPLQDIGLPLSDYLDRLLAGAQTGAASVQIGGVLGEPETRIVPLADVRGTLDRLLGTAAE